MLVNSESNFFQKNPRENIFKNSKSKQHCEKQPFSAMSGIISPPCHLIQPITADETGRFRDVQKKYPDTVFGKVEQFTAEKAQK
jgi:hypothetical protein